MPNFSLFTGFFVEEKDVKRTQNARLEINFVTTTERYFFSNQKIRNFALRKEKQKL